jgi:hypothetical protein
MVPIVVRNSERFRRLHDVLNANSRDRVRILAKHFASVLFTSVLLNSREFALLREDSRLKCCGALEAERGYEYRPLS